MATAITVSQEELLVLCAVAQVPPLVALAESAFSTLPPEQQVIATITAERALRARGLVARRGAALCFAADDVRAILTIMAQAPQSLALRVAPPDQPSIQAFGYFGADTGREASVTHVVEDGDLHVLSGPVAVATALDDLLALLALPAIPAPDPPLVLRLPETLLNQVADLSGHDN